MSVHNHFIQLLDMKIKRLHAVLEELKESGKNETKSTAGDKHETALAMLQIEQANIRGQLQTLIDQKSALETLDPLVSSTQPRKGSIVTTDKGFFYISAALGKAVLDNKHIIAISPHSPLGVKLLGSRVGEVIEVNAINYKIQANDEYEVF